ncbi:MAG: hypothetical protein ACMXX8_03240, partial [Candidatus Woesearchaeota archaeon]
MKKLVNLFFNKLGYKIIKDIPEKEILDSPVESLYNLRERCALPVYINPFNIKIQDCISHNGFSFSSDGWHPFVETIKQYSNDKNLKYKNSLL